MITKKDITLLIDGLLNGLYKIPISNEMNIKIIRGRISIFNLTKMSVSNIQSIFLVLGVNFAN
jgi:hypothetical protein